MHLPFFGSAAQIAPSVQPSTPGRRRGKLRLLLAAHERAIGCDAERRKSACQGLGDRKSAVGQGDHAVGEQVAGVGIAIRPSVIAATRRHSQ